MSDDDSMQVSMAPGVLRGHVRRADIVALGTANAVKACVDLAMELDGALMLVGWVFDPNNIVQGFVRLVPSDVAGEASAVYALEPDSDNVQIGRVSRPDVAVAMAADGGASERLGFVLVIPGGLGGGTLGLALRDGRYARLPYEPIRYVDKVREGLELCWGVSGPAMLSSALAALGESHALVGLLGELANKNTRPRRSIGNCDLAINVGGQIGILTGWIGKRSVDIESVQMVIGGRVIDITPSMMRYHRPDLLKAYPWSGGELLGFVSVVSLPAGAGLIVSIDVHCRDGSQQSFGATADRIFWRDLETQLERHPALFGPILHLLQQIDTGDMPKATLDEHRSALRQHVFPAWVRTLPVNIEHPGKVVGSIDRVYPLGGDGVLIFGWMYFPQQQPVSITIQAESGEEVRVDGLFVPVLRTDVHSSFSDRYPEIGKRRGFVCRVPLPTDLGDARALCINLGQQGNVWLNIPTDQPLRDGIGQVKEILDLLNDPEHMRHGLFRLFEEALGPALDAIHRKSSTRARTLHSRTFREAVAEPAASVVVPLAEGDADRIRHLLAQFADDPDFRAAELVFVVCDPDMAADALDIAARYQWLFEVPFSVVWGELSIDPATANNIGARYARAEYLVFLHPDVLPQQPGWLGILRHALDSGPDAGAVGPLLQLPGGSVDSAGVYPRVDESLPGFLLRAHHNRGVVWDGAEAVRAHPMISTACFMVRGSDCRAVGGFDEGYLPGDFDAFDLLSALRHHGKRLYLVPRALLWRVVTPRRVSGAEQRVAWLTDLFNSWRYQEKIKRGELADPWDWGAREGRQT